MEKELNSCTGVLLRAHITGHGHSTLFGTYQKIGNLFYPVHISGLLHNLQKLIIQHSNFFITKLADEMLRTQFPNFSQVLWNLLTLIKKVKTSTIFSPLYKC
jgi:hypothetical protein